jgi:Domain of unknown function DUF29
MPERTLEMNLADLYEADETAWLEEMSRLAATRDGDHLDYEHLAEFLSDMAKRDRREVVSRLTILLTHLLKWEAQPERRGKSWESTIRAQRRELSQMLESGTLRTHADDELTKVFDWAVDDAMSECDLPREAFPELCPYSLDSALGTE